MISSIALVVLTLPVAMATRSKARVAIATFQPPSTAPTTASSGRKTSSRKTSLNSASPSMCASGREDLVPRLREAAGTAGAGINPGVAHLAAVLPGHADAEGQAAGSRLAYRYNGMANLSESR